MDSLNDADYMMPITGSTQLLGVIGYPITHSLSPVMHNAAIAELGLGYVYLPFAIAPADLATAVAGFAAIGLQGFNVTIPHKQAIIPLLRHISPLAKQIGAVNTVWWADGGWHGTNTDVTGFLSPLQAYSRVWAKETVIILGHGGAARAVVAGCITLGCAAIQVIGRNPSKRQAFLASWTDPEVTRRLSVHGWDDLPRLLPRASMVVNTTPIGMAPEVEISPLSREVLATLPPETIVYDLIYNPRPTLLLHQASAQGAIAIDGLEMLVQQGAAALTQWVHQPAPVQIMRHALLTALPPTDESP